MECIVKFVSNYLRKQLQKEQSLQLPKHRQSHAAFRLQYLHSKRQSQSHAHLDGAHNTNTIIQEVRYGC